MIAKSVKTRPLSQVDEGEVVTLIGIDAGHALRSRLTAMGLLPNVQIQVVRKGGRGPFVVGLKNSKIALGRGVVDKIRVA